MFRLEVGDRHSFSRSDRRLQVLVIKRSSVIALAARETVRRPSTLGNDRDELRRVQDHIMLLIKTAQERVAGFSWKWRHARPVRPRSNCRCRVRHRRLSRPPRNVSRTLTQLEIRGYRVPTSRRIGCAIAPR